MEYQEHYDNMKQRNDLCDVATNNGFRMLHDNFDADWKRGDEPYGTMIFTNEPAPQGLPTRDLAAEIDEIKTEIEKLKEVKNKE
ncbi:unnamed protein product [marine sediment metagenome]|uniref:Uncharacterized protein n=1 Tax=marine sediment metagenome TaxID=412755 RepID=X1D5T1_9ZZZZ